MLWVRLLKILLLGVWLLRILLLHIMLLSIIRILCRISDGGRHDDRDTNYRSRIPLISMPSTPSTVPPTRPVFAPRVGSFRKDLLLMVSAVSMVRRCSAGECPG